MCVLTVISRKSAAISMARFGFRIARAVEEPLVVLCLDSGVGSDEAMVLSPGDELPEGVPATVAAVCEELSRDPRPAELEDDGAVKPGRPLADPEVEVRWLTTTRRLSAVLDQLRQVGARFLIAAKYKPKAKEVTLARKLFTSAPCHTLLVRLGDSEDVELEHILVPTAGGPHAATALRLGERLASASGGEAVALYVGSNAGDLAQEVGERILGKVLEEAGVSERSHVTARVVLGADRLEAIRKVAAEGFDLVLLGDSNAGTLRRRLFGTLPEALLLGARSTRIAVIRRRWHLMHRLRRRVGRWLDVFIPQMERSHRVALYEKLQSGSKWNFDFMALISLSTAIAALGLLQDSAAVVIGAMLVAPLMTPILGAGLALVQGNWPLLKASGRAIVSGYLMALLIGIMLGVIFRIPELTPQLEARGSPTLLDLGVAFLSGIAAAFCLGRPGLLAALPGVAIAAALVPPIATTGVCLALGESSNASGSALLFVTNVVAIILGAALSLYASGLRGKAGAGSHQKWVRWAFMILLLGTVGLAVPLRSGLQTLLAGNAAPAIPVGLEERLAGELKAEIHIQGIQLRNRGSRQVIEIDVESTTPLTPELSNKIVGLVRAEMGNRQAVRISTRLVTEFAGQP